MRLIETRPVKLAERNMCWLLSIDGNQSANINRPQRSKPTNKGFCQKALVTWTVYELWERSLTVRFSDSDGQPSSTGEAYKRCADTTKCVGANPTSPTYKVRYISEPEGKLVCPIERQMGALTA